MPSIAESKRQVSEGLSAAGTDHDAILASLQDEIDKHNRATDSSTRSHRRSKRRHDSDERDTESNHRRERHLRFRFKSGVEEPRRKRRSKRSYSSKPTPDDEETQTAHPFPREPANPDVPDLPSNTAAFQTSLFDALADDEAAAYWESVYSQPIHVYSRPKAETATGELEEMDDESYAAYVQRKMWEKQHPEMVEEQERAARKRREEAEAKEARREAFVRARQKEAWDRASRAQGTGREDDRYEYTFDFRDRDTERKEKKPDRDLYARAWASYLAAWDTLKAALLAPPSPSAKPPKPPSKRIPWPTLQNRPATRPNIEEFMRHIPGDGAETLQALKVERVRWHPDKVQQRFGGAVDEGTMKVVTGVFQVVDSMVEEERKKEA